MFSMCGGFISKKASLNFHVDMFHYIGFSLVMPTAINPRAQFNQNGQVFETAAIGTALPVKMRFIAPLRLIGSILLAFTP